MQFYLLISFVATLMPNIEGHSYGENLLERLNNDIRHMDDLIVIIQKHYRGQMESSRQIYPKNYESTLRKASTTIGRALRLMESIDSPSRRSEDQDDVMNSLSIDQEQDSRELTRRSNDLKWKTNFYKALSRALKDEFQDEQLIQENIHDGFAPPTLLQKRGGQ